MGRPKGGYDIDGEPVPGISTVAKVGEDPGGLLHYHWHEGHAWKGTYAQWKHRAGQPTDIGHAVHGLFECFLLGRPEPDLLHLDGPALEKARISFGAATVWAAQSKLEITHTELTLISRVMRVGGTIDAAARVMGLRSIVDWKSSKGVYGDMVCQLAGYGMAWDENFPEDPITGGYHLVRFDKITGGFDHRWWPDLPGAKRAFLRKRALYDDLRGVEK